MELPTDIWREILSYTDKNIDGKIKEMSINELTETSTKVSLELFDRTLQIKSKFMCNDVIEIESKSCGCKNFAVIKSLAYNENHPTTIKVFYVRPTNRNTNFGMFRLDARPVGRVCLVLNNIKLIQSSLDIISNNKLIASQTKEYDVVQISNKLFDCEDHNDWYRYYGLIKNKISKNHIIVQRVLFGIEEVSRQPYINLEDCWRINTRQVLKIIDLDRPDTELDGVVFNILKQKIEFQKQLNKISKVQ